MAKAKKYFADTTLVYYRLHGHTLQADAVKEAVGTDRLEVSTFVRGEYIRGYIPGLIDLYSAIKEENSVANGILVFTSYAAQRSRMLSKAFTGFIQTIYEFDDFNNVQKTLRRLGEFIRNRLLCFDAAFVNPVRDPLRCEFGFMSFPQESFDEQHLFDFYQEVADSRVDPDCDQCDFRKKQIAALAASGTDLYSAAQQQNYKEHKGYVEQAKRTQTAVNTKRKEPSCWHCDRLGDTIIALSAPGGSTILTGDKQAFPALAAILQKEIKLIPSLKQLREQRGPL